MDEMKCFCALIVQLMDDYSENMFEDGVLTLSFDCYDYHYECTMERTLKDGEENEKTNN